MALIFYVAADWTKKKYCHPPSPLQFNVLVLCIPGITLIHIDVEHNHCLQINVKGLILFCRGIKMYAILKNASVCRNY